MILLPAIDLMDGQVVRLRQGKAEDKTVYSSDPAALARRWEQEGGDYLHVVDLDAAFSGRSGRGESGSPARNPRRDHHSLRTRWRPARRGDGAARHWISACRAW